MDAANADYIAEDGVLYSRDKKILVSYPAGKTGEKFHIPEGVERIDDAAFMENPYLKEVIFSDTVKEVGDAAFQGCSALRTITVNEGLELVEAEAFEKCPKLKKPDIPAKTDLAEEGIF